MRHNCYLSNQNIEIELHCVYQIIFEWIPCGTESPRGIHEVLEALRLLPFPRWGVSGDEHRLQTNNLYPITIETLTLTKLSHQHHYHHMAGDPTA